MVLPRALLTTYLICYTAYSQIAFSDLSKIGVIKARNYNLKITATPTYQYMVLKLIPNVKNMTDCGKDHLENYKQMLRRILKPIDDSINMMRRVVTDRPDNYRFWGAVVGGIALGVATSAQITAGVALHNSLENAKAILQLKDAIKQTNQAVSEVISSQRKTVTVINALQDQINNNLVPSIRSIGCQAVGNTFGLRLTQYFSEISLIFGPNLRDPSSETLSIQAISRAFNGDFDSLLKALGYKESDLMDVLESGSIRGRIIAVSMDDYFLVMQIEYPSLTSIPDATVQKFNLISYNHGGSEWMTLFPKALLKRGTYLSNIDISDCTETSNTMLCPTDTSSPLSQNVFNCATGKINECARIRVVNSHAPRYALSDGVMFLNCMPINCRCSDPDYAIIHEPDTTTVMISSEDCNEILLDGFYVTVGKRVLNRSLYTGEVEVGGEVSIDPIDVSTEIADIQGTLDKAQEELDKSNEILSKVNPKIINMKGFVTIIIFVVLFGIYCVVSLIWLIYLTKHMMPQYRLLTYRDRSPTISTLSSAVSAQSQ
uniref:Fusion glycoprotein F0 n=1 Tax=Jeilongvirus sp. TaxID=2686070 RepID=A0A8F7CFD7_9MONO|nr:F protein [Jeilongvirus sp.]QXU63482.1 F protein [Jeilongvirus sp.]